jgi:GNAT superfamily N-acetyltransferase
MLSTDQKRSRPAAAVRDMIPADLDPVGEVLFHAFNAGAARHGYAPKLKSVREATAWAGAILRHAPHEIVVAEADGRVAGICCLHPRGENGGIGPVAVDPSFQGEGIGRAMLKVVLERASGLASVRLYQEAYNAASFSLYYAEGFLPAADLLDMTAEPEGSGVVPNGPVEEMSPQAIDEGLDYDGPRSRYDRRGDLAFFLRWGKVFVTRSGGRISGMLSCLPGPASVQCGPLVAEGEEEAQRLYEHARAVYRDRQCQTRIMARDRSLAAALRGLGFRISCLNLLMVRGAWRPGKYIEAFGRFPEGA